MHYFRSITETRCAQAGEGIGEIDKPAVRAQVQQSPSARHDETLSPATATPARTSINTSAAERARKRQGLTFTGVEVAPNGSPMAAETDCTSSHRDGRAAQVRTIAGASGSSSSARTSVGANTFSNSLGSNSIASISTR